MVTTNHPSGTDADASLRSLRTVHLLSVVALVLSLAPICLGSLVTTLGAGMAFLDWPTSDGQGMLAYSWLQSSGDKFVEHGHRLAGLLIGFVSLALFGTAWCLRVGRSVRMCCLIVLLGVVFQGVLGGLRVRLDRQVVALGHSVFGCFVFTALWFTASVTRPRKIEPEKVSSQSGWLQVWAAILPVVCVAQYIVGAFIRHLGEYLHLHLAGAISVVAVATAATIVAYRVSPTTGRRIARSVMVFVGLQISLGIVVWLQKFGFAPLGWVAEYHSVAQIASRSAHTVIGMCVVASAVNWSASVFRVSNWVSQMAVGEIGAGKSQSFRSALS